MKFKIFIASLLIAGSAIGSFAQGYMDGIEFYKIDEYTNARELLNRNLNAPGTDKALSLYYLGQIDLKYAKMWKRNGDAAKAQQCYNDAKSKFDQGIAANPKCAYNYVGLGALALYNGDVKGAETQFDLAKKQVKKDPKLVTAIAREFYNADPVAYQKQITKNIETAHKWGKDKDPDVFILEGDMLADKQEWGEAARTYNNAFYYDPDNIESQVKYANTYIKVNPQFAIGQLEDLLTKVPNSALVQRQLADKYYDDNQGTKALDMYKRLMDNPNHFGQDELRYAQLLFATQDYDGVLQVANALDAKSADDSSEKFIAKRLALYSLVRQKNWDDAISCGEKFFALRPDSPADYNENDYTYYSNALRGAGRLGDALDILKNAAEVHPENLNFKRSLADAYYEKDQYTDAIEMLEPVVENEGVKMSDYVTLASCYMQRAYANADESAKAADLNQAVKWANEAVKADGESINAAFLKARVLSARDGQDSNEALNAFNRVVKLVDDAVAGGADKSRYAVVYRLSYNYMALYYLKQGDKATARSYFEKQLIYDPDNNAVREQIKKLS